jgi:hypothetical protein
MRWQDVVFMHPASARARMPCFACFTVCGVEREARPLFWGIWEKEMFNEIRDVAGRESRERIIDNLCSL